MNRFIVLLIIVSTFLFSATSYPASNLPSEEVSKNKLPKSLNSNLENQSETNFFDKKEKQTKRKTHKKEKDKNKIKPFQTLRKIKQLKKMLKDSKQNYKENFPKIVKSKKQDEDCDIPVNKLDWRVGLALGCVIAMLVLPFLTAIAASYVAVSSATSFVVIDALGAIAALFSPLLGLIGFFTGLSALKRYSYKNDCENYIANRKNRNVAMIATIIGGLIPLLLLLLVFLLILSLTLGGF